MSLAMGTLPGVSLKASWERSVCAAGAEEHDLLSSASGRGPASLRRNCQPVPLVAASRRFDGGGESHCRIGRRFRSRFAAPLPMCDGESPRIFLPEPPVFGTICRMPPQRGHFAMRPTFSSELLFMTIRTCEFNNHHRAQTVGTFDRANSTLPGERRPIKIVVVWWSGRQLLPSAAACGGRAGFFVGPTLRPTPHARIADLSPRGIEIQQLLSHAKFSAVAAHSPFLHDAFNYADFPSFVPAVMPASRSARNSAGGRGLAQMQVDHQHSQGIGTSQNRGAGGLRRHERHPQGQAGSQAYRARRSCSTPTPPLPSGQAAW